MVTRTIKTVEGLEYSGSIHQFVDYQDYVEYQQFFSRTRIYKPAIIEDVISSNLFDVIRFVGIASIFIVAFSSLCSALDPNSPSSENVQSSRASSPFFIAQHSTLEMRQ